MQGPQLKKMAFWKRCCLRRIGTNLQSWPFAGCNGLLVSWRFFKETLVGLLTFRSLTVPCSNVVLDLWRSNLIQQQKLLKTWQVFGEELQWRSWEVWADCDIPGLSSALSCAAMLHCSPCYHFSSSQWSLWSLWSSSLLALCCVAVCHCSCLGAWQVPLFKKQLPTSELPKERIFFLILFDPLLAAIKSIEVAQMLEEKTWKRDEKLVEQGEWQWQIMTDHNRCKLRTWCKIV